MMTLKTLGVTIFSLAVRELRSRPDRVDGVYCRADLCSRWGPSWRGRLPSRRRR